MVDDMPNETPDTIKNTPAYRRMLKRERMKQEKKAGMLENQGPITILVVGIIDFAIDIFTKLGLMIWDFSTSGFNTVYDLIYGSFDGFIPNSEKFGTIVSTKPLRYLVTFLIPPVGIFISKGLSSWFNILICTILTFVHFLLGAVYAFVITFTNRYADRYETMEYKRLMLIREYVNTCTGNTSSDMDADKSPFALIYTIVFFICFFGLLYAGFKYF